MLIITGERQTRRALGWGADFCPFCREMTAMKVSRLGRVTHVYGISFGAGAFTRYEEKCSHCRYRFYRETLIHPHLVAQEIPMPQLQAQTLPVLPPELLHRLALEEKLRRHPASLEANQREQLIAEQIYLPINKMEMEFGGCRFDRFFWAVFVGFLVIFIVSITIIEQYALDQLPMAVFIGVGIGIAVLITTQCTAKQRYIRRHVLPWYQSGLKGLNPSYAELLAYLSDAKNQGYYLGDVTPAQILSSFQELAGSVPSGANPYRRR